LSRFNASTTLFAAIWCEDNNLPEAMSVLPHLLDKSIRFIDGILHRVNESGDVAFMDTDLFHGIIVGALAGG
jgi:hypothetical protein